MPNFFFLLSVSRLKKKPQVGLPTVLNGAIEFELFLALPGSEVVVFRSCCGNTMPWVEMRSAPKVSASPCEDLGRWLRSTLKCRLYLLLRPSLCKRKASSRSQVTVRFSGVPSIVNSESPRAAWEGWLTCMLSVVVILATAARVSAKWRAPSCLWCVLSCGGKSSGLGYLELLSQPGRPGVLLAAVLASTPLGQLATTARRWARRALWGQRIVLTGNVHCWRRLVDF